MIQLLLWVISSVAPPPPSRADRKGGSVQTLPAPRSQRMERHSVGRHTEWRSIPILMDCPQCSSTFLYWQ